MIELYHFWASFCSIKVRLCLAEKKLPWISREVDLMKLEHTSPAYLKINPNGVVPALVHDGKAIWESTFINEYLDEVFPDVPLRPADPAQRARMRYWVKYEDDVLHPVIRPATFALMMAPLLARLDDDALEELVAKHPNKARAEQYRRAARTPPDPDALKETKAQIDAALDRLEKQLSETPYLAGDTYSLADVAGAPFIDRLEELDFMDLWAKRPGVRAWIERLKARPAYREAIPKQNQRMPLEKVTGV
jgi:glutathione S-transferase